jgi:outer membrane receptor protein involved in Fe transport
MTVGKAADPPRQAEIDPIERSIFRGLNMHRQLFCSTLLAGVAMASGALAQPAEPGGELLDEIVVTATRQTDTVNRVPLSITAVTQQTMDQQNIRTAADLVRGIPGVRLDNTGSANATQTISIRGLSSGSGSPTTGVYLDDSPLAKRAGPRGSGAPIPQLFDLERVEVLKGPQGTLYGAGSQGGTVRFITPAPSLTRYSAFARGELATTKDGSLSYETGVAVGGPIIQDKLGFRVSVYNRHNGGYLDYVYRLTGERVAKDTNDADTRAIRLAVTWAPTERLKITPALYWSRQTVDDQDAYWEDVAQFTQPAKTTGGYTHPAHTYGPYNFYGPYVSGDVCNVGDNYVNVVPVCVPKQYSASELFLPSLTVDYAFDKMTVKGVLSYIGDRSKGNFDFSYQEPQNHQAGVPFVYDLPLYQSYPRFTNERSGITSELRFASANPGSRLSWVAGLYYTNVDISAYTYYVANADDLTKVVYGLPASSIFGIPLLPGNLEYYRDFRLEDSEIAAYGEGTFALTDKFKLIAGVRLSRTEFSYWQETGGPIGGSARGVYSGTVIESPVSPKFGAQYLIDDRNQLYATVSKGYRVGGVNQPPPANCAADLASLGITSTPTTFDSDTVWNYEAGAKLRVFGAQINSSVFYLEWTDTQTNYGLPTCGFGYTLNAGKAVSKGFDVQAQKRFGPFTATIAAGYTDAKYTEGVVGPAPRFTVYIQKGDRLPVPEWTVNLGLRYDFRVFDRNAYLRGDYQYSSSFERGVRFGSAGYSPDTRIAEATNFVTARAGVDLGPLEVSAFVDNLLNSQDILSTSGGRTGCNATSGAACSVYSQYNPVFRRTTFRPRTIGITASYRY